MPYAPTVNDRSGEILAGYQTNAAEIKAAGQQALADGIARGATSAIGGALGAMTDTNTAGMITDGKGRAVPGLGASIDAARERAIKYDAAAGMLDTYKQNAGALGLDLQMLQGLEEKHAKDPDKLIGALTVVGSMADNYMATQRQNAQYTNALELARQKAALNASGGGSNPALSVEVADGIDIWQ